jgi:hypothetical protein
LGGLRQQFDAPGEFTPASQKLKEAHKVLKAMDRLGIVPDVETSFQFGLVVLQTTSWTQNLDKIKQMYSLAVHGGLQTLWRLGRSVKNGVFAQPDAGLLECPLPKHLMQLIRILGLAGDGEGILELAHWIGLHHDQLKSTHLSSVTGAASMKKALCHLRMFLEGGWAESESQSEELRLVNPELVEEISRKLEPLGWPSDDEMAQFLEKYQQWTLTLRRARRTFTEPT